MLFSVKMFIGRDVTYKEQPIQILGKRLKVLRNKEIPFVKGLWKHHKEEEAIWKLKSEMLQKYLYLIFNLMYSEFWDKIHLRRIGCKTPKFQKK